MADDRQISREDQRSVNLWVRPPPTGTYQCHRVTPTGRGIMLTVNLMKLTTFTTSKPTDGGRSGGAAHRMPDLKRLSSQQPVVDGP